MFRKLSIIIPLYNEEKTIHKVLENISSVTLINNIEKEIIVINDGSTDNSFKIVSDFISDNSNMNIKCINYKKNLGKGTAVNTGIHYATGDFIIIQDADLEYNPLDYNKLIQPIIDDIADVVFGSRFIGSKPRKTMFFLHTIGNNILTFICNILSNKYYTDMTTCYKLLSTELIRSIELKEKRFSFDPELTIKISKIPKLRIYEVGISYNGRKFQEGKKINWHDAVRQIYSMIKYSIFTS